MIVATAGHVDHGKTSLIRALSGVDTDRLPEEKTRGLSIDLGFAYLSHPSTGTTIGFIDVPGHEKFVRNMIAGVSGVDLALLVVAADDGPMPQTREHLAILSLLGVSEVVVAISKVDLVEPSQLVTVAQQIQECLTAAGLEASAVCRFSSLSGQGVEALREQLFARAERVQRSQRAGQFRMAIDRSFTVAGAGTVVTGTVFSGVVEVEQQVYLQSGSDAMRVRGIHAQNKAAMQAVAGQRCALNLAGARLHPDHFKRGDWICATVEQQPSRLIDVQIRPSSLVSKLAHWTPAHAHIGTADMPCRIALLETNSLAAGQTGFARLICDRPVGAVFGDRFVLRDQSARETIAGGRVLDNAPPARGRAKPQRLALLAALVSTRANADASGAETGSGENSDGGFEALANVLQIAPVGVDLAQYSQRFNWTPTQTLEFTQSVDTVVCGKLPQAYALTPAHWREVLATIESSIAQWHEQYPDILGVGEYQLQRRITPRLAKEVLNSGLKYLIAHHRVAKKGAVYCLANWRIRLNAEDALRWEKLLPHFEQAGFRAPRIVELAVAIDLPAAEVEQLLNHIVACGLLFRVSRNRYYLPATLLQLGEVAEQLIAQQQLTVAGFRDQSGIGRNLSVEMLEFFDEVQLTRREGETRQLVNTAAEVFGDN